MSPRRTVLAAVAIVLTVLAFVPPGAAHGADDVVWLPGRSLAATGLDLDDDGDHELVRLVHDGPGSFPMTEVWDVADGRWAQVGDPVPARPVADEPALEMTVVGQLLTWRRDGRDHVLVVTAHAAEFPGSTENCCLAIAELTLGPHGPSVDPIPLDGYGSASVIQPIDVEGDGTDELLVTTYAFGDAFTSQVDLVRWESSRLQGAQLPTDETTYVGSIGNADGVAGDDVLVSSDRGVGFSRLSWRDGVMVEEPWPGEEFAYPHGFVAGDLLVQVGEELQIVRWPRDEAPITIRSSELGPSSFSPLIATSGPDSVILMTSTGFGLAGPTSFVLGLNLEPLGQIQIPETEPLWALAGEYVPMDGSLVPFLGPFPIRRGETEVWQAGVIVTAGGPDGYRVRESSPYVGIVPLGVVGPGDGWIVAGPAMQHAPPGYPALLWHVAEVPADAGGLRLIPRDPSAGNLPVADAINISFGQAVEVQADEGERELLAGPDGFEVEISGPIATAIVVVGAGDSQVTYLTRNSPRVRVMPGRENLEEDEAFSRTVLVVMPDGRFVLERWSGRFLASDLDVSASAETVPFGLAATISGETIAGAVVRVPGGSATADANGRFHVRVDAPPWPQAVGVSIEDPFGRRLDVEVEVIGFVDYRGWPWMALVGAIVVAAGVALYLRVPRIRPDGEPPPEAPTLEEIEI